MKGLTPLVLGIVGTFFFSWAGLAWIPNFQIGHLDPQTDEDGSDVYPAPRSGMADRGRQIYAANGCVYCHTQQVRADYAASDIERKWGERRSAPRDYIFDRPVLLGKMRMGPDLANIGKRAPVEDANAPQQGSAAGGATAAATSANPSAASANSTASAANPTAGSANPSAASANPTAGPANATAGSANPTAASANPTASPANPTAGSTNATAASANMTASPANATAGSANAAAPAAGQAAPGSNATAAAPGSANAAVSAASSADNIAGPGGAPLPYSAAWHHQHLYSPRSINLDSTMPAYRFLYEKRKVEGQYAADALRLTGSDAPPPGYEIVPTYEARCLVAYLMSLDQSHALKEVKSTSPASPPAPAKKTQ